MPASQQAKWQALYQLDEQEADEKLAARQAAIEGKVNGN